MMANSNLQCTIKIVKPSKPNEITALAAFEKRDKVKSKLAFEFEDDQVREKRSNPCTLNSCRSRFT
jgi:hypothetical protein